MNSVRADVRAMERRRAQGAAPALAARRTDVPHQLGNALVVAPQERAREVVALARAEARDHARLESNVRGTPHDIPATKQCGACHSGEAGRVLGVSALQTAQLLCR